MTTAYKRLGAQLVVADTEETLYTVPADTSAIVNNIHVCNRGTSPRTFCIAITDGAGSAADEDFFYNDVAINANASVSFSLGIIMEATHQIRVEASHADINFLAFGVELT